MKKVIDNIKLFKKLSKNEDGSTDSIIFEKLLMEFENYILFKELYEEYDDIIIIKGAKKNRNRIKFKVQFRSNKILKNFINENEDKKIKYKENIYTPIFDQIDKKNIEIYFKKIGGKK